MIQYSQTMNNAFTLRLRYSIQDAHMTWNLEALQDSEHISAYTIENVITTWCKLMLRELH